VVDTIERNLRSLEASLRSKGVSRGRQNAPAKEPSQVRKVGRRIVARRPDETVLGRHKEWLLVSIDGWSANGWTSLKLFRDRIGPKNVWCLGAKEGRLARNKDAGLLTEHHPEILEWVLTTVRSN
jgi:hypothetical protein